MKIFNFNKKINQQNSGFTLIEILVSLAILSIVMVIAIGLLVTVNSGVRQTRSQRRVMDNLNFAMEHMSRAIIFSKNVTCGGPGSNLSCPYGTAGTQIINFEGDYNGVNTIISYQRMINTTPGPNFGFGYISRSVGGGNSVMLTDERIDIQELTFYVYHAEPFGSDPQQPKVVVVVRGVSYGSKTPENFFLQTTLSPRDLKL